MSSTQNQSKSLINTHNLIVSFGKHKGERWTRIPLSYLRWLINERTQYSDIAKAELERRGSSLTADKSVELSGHAIDKASLRLRRTWHETALDNNEGLFSWLERVAGEAFDNIEPDNTNVIYKRIKFVFMRGELYPVLKTVMPAPRVRYKQVSSGQNITEAYYKGAYIQFMANDTTIALYLIEYRNDPSEIINLIDLIKGDFPNRKVISSANINSTIRDILDKKNIEYTK